MPPLKKTTFGWQHNKYMAMIIHFRLELSEVGLARTNARAIMNRD